MKINGQIKYGWPAGVHGLGLMCHVQGELSPVMVTEHTAPDREHFWECWRALGGDGQGLVWESGKRFVSPGAVLEPAKVAQPSLWRRVLNWLDGIWERIMFRMFPYDTED